jgi:predicted RNase H-like nuclease (RuvC/YqgF family)
MQIEKQMNDCKNQSSYIALKRLNDENKLLFRRINFLEEKKRELEQELIELKAAVKENHRDISHHQLPEELKFLNKHN